MTEHNYRAARKEMTRAIHSIEKYAKKRLSKFDDPKLIIGINYLSEFNKTMSLGWKFSGDPVLQAKMNEWIPALDNALCVGEAMNAPSPNECYASWNSMPSSAEKRAGKVRKGLQILWHQHVRGTQYAEKKQMFSLVKKGLCRKFDWWDRVTEDAPFESVSIDDPRISEKLFQYIAPVLRSMCSV